MPTDLVTFAAKQNAKLDSYLFRLRAEDEEQPGVKKTVGGAIVTTAAGVGGVAGHRAVMRGYGGEGGAVQAYRNLGRNVGRSATDALKSGEAALANRVGGLRATVPGFVGRSATSQTVRAAGSLVGDRLKGILEKLALRK